MAQSEVVLHLFAAQVEIAVLQPHLFVRDGLFGRRERRRLRLVQQQQLLDDDLDLAGGHVRVFQAVATTTHAALNGDDVLRARCLGLGVGLARNLLVGDDLGDSCAVAQIQKDEVPVVAAPVDPAHQDHILSILLHTELAAPVGAL